MFPHVRMDPFKRISPSHAEVARGKLFLIPVRIERFPPSQQAARLFGAQPLLAIERFPILASFLWLSN